MYRQDLEAMGDRAFDAALNAHLHAIDMAEDREEWIEQRALELRKAHGPFSPAELGEALDSLHGKYAADLFNGPLETPLELMDFALATLKAVEDYWDGHFRDKATSDYAEPRF